LQCVAVCCSVLQYVVKIVCVRDAPPAPLFSHRYVHVLQCVSACCSVIQCVAMCCSVLQCVAVCCCVLQCVVFFLCVCNAPRAPRFSHRYVCMLQCVAVRCSIL